MILAATRAGEALAAAYAVVHDRAMRGLPICNPALAVEAVGFRPHGGSALGVVVTPWFMNLVLTALPGHEPADLPAGAIRSLTFPAGTVTFTVSEVAGVGRVDSASLFSPMFSFDNQATARETAAATLEALLAPPEPRALDRRGMLFGPARQRPPL